MARTVSEELRAAIERGPMTRYQLAKLTGVEQSSLSRFARRKAALSQDAIDKLCDVLRLRLVSERKGKRGDR